MILSILSILLISSFTFSPFEVSKRSQVKAAVHVNHFTR